MRYFYKGCVIELYKEECVGGWDMWYFTIMDEKTEEFIEDSFSECEDDMATMLEGLKLQVDNFIQEQRPRGQTG